MVSSVYAQEMYNHIQLSLAMVSSVALASVAAGYVTYMAIKDVYQFNIDHGIIWDPFSIWTFLLFPITCNVIMILPLSFTLTFLIDHISTRIVFFFRLDTYFDPIYNIVIIFAIAMYIHGTYIHLFTISIVYLSVWSIDMLIHDSFP
jgi:hypothetical protein